MINNLGLMTDEFGARSNDPRLMALGLGSMSMDLGARNNDKHGASDTEAVVNDHGLVTNNPGNSTEVIHHKCRLVSINACQSSCKVTVIVV
jgi:hypothetical protein